MDTTGECSICLQKLKDGRDLLRLSPCKHYFHRECFDNAIMHNLVTCPLCRNPFSTTTLEDDTHPQNISISPLIPFTCFITSRKEPKNSTPNTTMLKHVNSTTGETNLFTTIYCINNITITLDHLIIRLMNSTKEGNVTIPLINVCKIMLEPKKYSSQGMTSIEITNHAGYVIEHIEILINNCLKEKKDIFDMLHSAMKSHGGEIRHEKQMVDVDNWSPFIHEVEVEV